MTRAQRLRTWMGTRPAKVVLAVIVVLVVARIALPHVLKSVINDRLANLDGYRGRVLDVDVSLWRGAYTLDALLIEQIEGENRAPFVECDRIDISLEWAALFRGQVVAELVLDHPELNFVGGGGSENGKGNDWRDTVDDLVPITINHLAIHDGEVHYRDFSAQPDVDVQAANLEVEVTGLSTQVGPDGDRLPARLDAHGVVQRSGQLSLEGNLDPWREQPTFDLELAVEHLHARELNTFLRAYAGVDAEAGEFFVYTELRAEGGRFSGYVKPMVEGLSVFRFGEDGDAVDQFGDLVVQLFQDLLENHGTDRFATRVGLSGSFESPGIDPLEAVLGILSNSFIEAIQHGIEHPDGWHAEPPPRHARAD